MNQHFTRRVVRPLALATLTALSLSLSACQSNGSLGSMMNSGSSIFQQLGGMNTVMQLASVFMQSAGQDSQLSSLFQGADKASLTGQVANQLCASLGGGCAAPLTNDQIKAGAKELTSAQSQAVSKNLNSALASAVTSPALRDVAGQVVGPQIGGILGALL